MKITGQWVDLRMEMLCALFESLTVAFLVLLFPLLLSQADQSHDDIMCVAILSLLEVQH